MKLKRILLILFAVSALLFLAKGTIAKMAVSAGVRSVTGLGLRVQRMEVGVFRSRVIVRGLKVLNPAGFPEEVMADLPEIYVDYDLPALFRGTAHLTEMRLELKELIVVKNAAGALNLNSIKTVQKAKQEGPAQPAQANAGKKPAVRIDDLHLKIGKVVYKDYTRGSPPQIQEFPVHLDQRYRNITDPMELGSLVVSRALVNTTIASLANFDLGAVNRQVQGILRDPLGTTGRIGSGALDAAGGAADTAAGIVKNTVGALKKLLPTGEQK